MIRRIARIAAVLCAVLAVIVPFAPSPSSAAAPQETGWWSRRVPLQGDVEGASARKAVRFNAANSPGQEIPIPTTVPGSGPVPTVPLPVPPPTIPKPPVTLPDDGGPGTPNPTVPDGGLWVANDSTGASAVSALRFRGDIGAARLILTFAPGSTTAGPLVACPVLSEWTAGPEGAWRDRPAHDCDRLSLSGRVTSDATGVEFNIPQGFQPFGERVFDILILPSPVSGDVFSVYFQKPDENSLDVSQGQDLPTFEPDFEPDPFTLPTTPPFESFDSGAPFDDGGSFDSGAPPVTEEATPTVDLSGDDGSPLPTPIAGVFEPFTESRAGRILSMVVLFAMGGGLWWLSSQSIRHPRLIGGLASGAPAVVEVPADLGRGIGRFRRDRSAPPNRL